ncbi:DUF7287 family protein [Methanocella sp. MCL-LM]|uniref:DUF7287 family protein n=1 Tax=Methanocella sp. MCL-LM TaxID=3412035 RepID=UPI003C774711
MKRIKKNGEGQTSLDFLIGITLFLLVFIFVFAFIPRMFTPFQSNSDELTMAADRAAGVLVENKLVDTGLGVYEGAPTPGIIKKVAYEDLWKYIDKSSPDLDPAIVDLTKKHLGLGYEKSFGKSAATPSEQFYKVQMEIITPGPGSPLTHAIISPDGDPVGSNVGQSKRFVYIHDTSSPAGTYTEAILIVRVW